MLVMWCLTVFSVRCNCTDLFIAVASGDPLEDLPLPLGKVVKRTG